MQNRRLQPRAPILTLAQLLAWADAHHQRCGKWPKQSTPGRIVGSLGEKWVNINAALRLGLRGLPGGSSLACLLAERRGVRNHMALPPFAHQQILAWADAHHARTGQWPDKNSGPVDGERETWLAVDVALVQGHRGLSPGSSLARLLSEERSVRSPRYAPQLRIGKILDWADAHFRATGKWPKHHSGPVPDSGGETWMAVQTALNVGLRGLAGGSTLARLLAAKRGVRNHKQLPRLTQEQILSWADAWFRRSGRWPKDRSGPIPESPGDTWQHIEDALYQGQRGLAGGSSLARLLARRRGVRNIQQLPRLRLRRILTWIKQLYRTTGKWPTRESGPVAGTEETWSAIDSALKKAGRGLRGKSSLAQEVKRLLIKGAPRPARGVPAVSW